MLTHFISSLWNVQDILLYYHVKLAILVSNISTEIFFFLMLFSDFSIQILS